MGRLQRRFRQLAGRLVPAKNGMVLPAPGQGLRSNAMPHGPVTGYVLAVVLESGAPARTRRAPYSGVHAFGAALALVVVARLDAAAIPAPSSVAKHIIEQ